MTSSSRVSILAVLSLGVLSLANALDFSNIDLGKAVSGSAKLVKAAKGISDEDDWFPRTRGDRPAHLWFTRDDLVVPPHPRGLGP